MKTLTSKIDDSGVVHLTLNRPAVHNAFDDELIMELTSTLEQAAGEAEIRVLVLRGKGKSFSAGADLNWMHRAADYSPEENRADADRLAAMLHTLDRFPAPTVAAVNGAAFGGGVGLVASTGFRPSHFLPVGSPVRADTRCYQPFRRQRHWSARSAPIFLDG